MEKNRRAEGKSEVGAGLIGLKRLGVLNSTVRVLLQFNELCGSVRDPGRCFRVVVWAQISIII